MIELRKLVKIAFLKYIGNIKISYSRQGCHFPFRRLSAMNISDKPFHRYMRKDFSFTYVFFRNGIKMSGEKRLRSIDANITATRMKRNKLEHPKAKWSLIEREGKVYIFDRLSWAIVFY